MCVHLHLREWVA